MAAEKILEYLEDVSIRSDFMANGAGIQPKAYGELSIISGKVPQSRWSRDIGKERIQVNFVNEIPDADVCLCWINRSGEFKGKLVIKHGKRMAQKTFLGHTFAVTCGGEEWAFVYTPTEDAPSRHVHVVTICKNGEVRCGVEKLPEKPQNPEYEAVLVCGFTLMLAKQQGKNLFECLPGVKVAIEQDLDLICQIIPKPALNFLKTTKIWLNDGYVYKDGAESGRNEPYAPPRAEMCFHPSSEWLKSHGNLGEKGECVEVYRVKDWLRRRGYMPMVLLHELGHSYHWHLDYENPWIKECYQKAMDSGVYENVDFVLGGKMKAYAATNQMEYFSECTEAFWGMNDYFPFNKSQLKQVDPFGFEMCERIWNLSESEIDEMHQQTLKRREESRAAGKEEQH